MGDEKREVSHSIPASAFMTDFNACGLHPVPVAAVLRIKLFHPAIHLHALHCLFSVSWLKW